MRFNTAVTLATAGLAAAIPVPAPSDSVPATNGEIQAQECGITGCESSKITPEYLEAVKVWANPTVKREFWQPDTPEQHEALEALATRQVPENVAIICGAGLSSFSPMCDYSQYSRRSQDTPEQHEAREALATRQVPEHVAIVCGAGLGSFSPMCDYSQYSRRSQGTSQQPEAVATASGDNSPPSKRQIFSGEMPLACKAGLGSFSPMCNPMNYSRRSQGTSEQPEAVAAPSGDNSPLSKRQVPDDVALICGAGLASFSLMCDYSQYSRRSQGTSQQFQA